jgi:hypothetical protein
MTRHIYYDHQCPACGAHFVPYETGVACPRCAKPSDQVFDFVTPAIDSMLANKKKLGRYVPRGWYINGIADHVLHILFYLFDEHEADQPDRDIAAFAAEYLELLDWEDEGYLRGHVHAIAVKLGQRLQDPAEVVRWEEAEKEREAHADRLRRKRESEAASGDEGASSSP